MPEAFSDGWATQQGAVDSGGWAITGDFGDESVFIDPVPCPTQGDLLTGGGWHG